VLSTLKKYLYNNVYINILQSSNNINVYVEEISYNGSSENFEKNFKSSERSAMLEFVVANMKRSPINYVSILDPSLTQGAAPACTPKEIEKYCDLEEYEYVCVDDSWSYYTSKFDLLELKGRYNKTGLDFVFSPFYMLENFYKDKVKGEISLFILVNEDYMSLSIFEKSNLKYASLLDLQQESESDDELIMDEDDEEELILDEIQSNSVDLEGIDVDDDIEGLDDFDDLDDLDGFDDLDDFEDSEDLDETYEDNDKPVEDIIEGDTFGDDYHRFALIQSAVNNFYKDPKFDSEFIQHAYIADGISLSPEFKRFLEEEMFLNVVIRKIDIEQELCDLAKVEKK